MLLVLLLLSSLVLRAHAQGSFGALPDDALLQTLAAANVSRPCLSDIRTLYLNLQNLTLWAFEMWDASAKQPSGMLRGTAYQLGDYDECLHPAGGARGINRQYCLTDVRVLADPGDSREAVEALYKEGGARVARDVVHWATCAPAQCPPAELQHVLSALVSSAAPPPAGLRYSLQQPTCQLQLPPPDSLPTSLLLLGGLLGGMLLLVLAATAYHTYCNMQQRECAPLVLGLSLHEQLRKLGRAGRAGGGLDELYGVRVLSICLVILDHRIGTTIAGAVSNRSYLEELYGSFEAVFICHGDLLVDSFFVLSGMLATHSLLKQSRSPSVAGSLVMVVMRYIRLVPTCGVAMLLVSSLPVLVSGPLAPSVLQPEARYCNTNWWTNLLMISNFVREEDMCMVHSWYIPVDFHLFLLALLVTPALRSRPRTGLLLVAALLLLAILAPALVTLQHHLPAMLLFFPDFLSSPRQHAVFQQIYIKSHMRAAPYLLGVLSAFLVQRYRRAQPILSAVTSQVICALSLLTLLGVMASGAVFYRTERPRVALEAALYAGLHRPAWAAALCALLLACSMGRVPVVTAILTWRPWRVLGRLVYGAYLLHMPLQLRAVASTRHPFHLDFFTLLGLSLGDVVISFVAALVVYLLVEAPVMEISKLLFLKPRRDSGESANKQSPPALHKAYYTNTGAELELGAGPRGGDKPEQAGTLPPLPARKTVA